MTHGIKKGRARTLGFTLVELAIVMAVSGLLFGSLFEVLSNSQGQVTAQETAQQQQNIIRAARTLVVNGFNTITAAGTAPVGPATAAGYAGDVVGSLVPAAPATNHYGQTYHVYIRIEQESPAVVSFTVMTSGGTVISDSLGGTIASLTGADGGFIYSLIGTGTCAVGNIVSNFGSDCTHTPASYGAASPGGGHLASIDYVTQYDLGGNVSQYLSRLEIPAAGSTMNTMQAELQFGTVASAGLTGADAVTGPGIAMGGNNLYMMGRTAAGSPANASSIFMEGGTIDMNIGGGTGGGALNMDSGNINYVGSIGFGPGNVCNMGYDTESNPAPPPATITTLYIGGCDFDTGGGNVYIANGYYTGVLQSVSFVYSSDRRLKTDIQPLPHDALQKLLALTPVDFRWKKTGKKDIGLIAQDVQKQFPDLVMKDKDGYLAVEMGNLVSPIIEALQQLEKQNEDLRAQIEEQNRKIEQMMDNKSH